MSFVEPVTHEGTTNDHLQCHDERHDRRTPPAIIPSPKNTLHESWDEDFASATPSADSVMHSHPILRIPSEIERSQKPIRLHLRNIRDFAAAATELSRVLGLVSDWRSDLNSSERGKTDGHTKLAVADQVLEEAEAIVALAENRDEYGVVSVDLPQPADCALEYSGDQRLHSAIGRSILEEIATISAHSSGSDPRVGFEPQVKVAQDVDEDYDFDDDKVWDTDTDEEHAPLSQNIAKPSRSTTSSKLDFSAEALPGLIERTHKLIAELSSALCNSNESQENSSA
ncbi:hypothetical protein V1517DRAFT_311843 [Lipomyces orientalis]|uniref:Uncharacterized protein n=1 Tax=Lipomyces orientalis TaxID=1233043 RepID=A0ACC3TZ69_9ASCO